MITDNYPIYDKNKKLNFTGWILLIAVVILAIFLFKECHRPNPAIAPVVTPTSVLKEIVRVDSIASKKYSDSVDKVIAYYKNISNKSERESDSLAGIYQVLLNDMNDVLTLSLPDTCEPFRLAVADLNKKLSLSTAQQEAACKSALNAQKNIVTQKDKLIANSKKDYTNLKKVFDTCIANQTALEKYIKKIKPRREIGVGLIGQSTWITPYKFEGGPMIYYRGKNGTQISAGVLTSQRVQLTISKPLFKL
jgi:hypothetical protein